MKFIDEAECEEVMRLRIEHLTQRNERVKLCNLLGWCLRSEQYSDDVEMLVQHFTLLHHLDRTDEFFQRVILPLSVTVFICLQLNCTRSLVSRLDQTVDDSPPFSSIVRVSSV